MTTPYEVVNASEFYTATDGTQFGNVHLSGVISGCAVTESASDMASNVAAGVILVNGAPTSTAGGSETLVSDPDNLCWNILWVDDAGAVQMAVGDPAPNAQTEPSKPLIAITAGTILKEYKVQPGQTVAANVSIALDKAVPTHTPALTIRKPTGQTVNNSTTLVNDTAFSFAVEADAVYLVEHTILLSTNTTADWKFDWSLPSGATGYGQVIPGQQAAAGSVIGQWVAGTPFNHVQGTSSPPMVVRINAIFAVSSTAGTAQFQWAQNTGDNSDTIVGANSVLSYTRVA